MSLWRLRGIPWLLALTSLGFISFFLTLSSLPYWAVEQGRSLPVAGALTTVMLGCTVAVQFAVPAAVRRLGAGRVLCMGVALLSVPSLGYLTGSGIIWLFAVAAVRGAGFSMVTVASVVLIGLLVPQPRRSEGVGMHGLAVNLPNLVALPLGVALALSGNFHAVAVAAAAPAVVLVFWRRIQQALPQATATTEASLEDSVPLVGGPERSRLAAPAIVLLSVCVVTAGYLTLLPVALADSARASTVLLVFGLSATLFRWRVGRVADRRGLRVLLPGSLLLAAVGLAVAGMGLRSQTELLIFVGSLVAGAGYGGIQNLTLVSALGRAGKGRLLRASAIWNVSFDAGIALGAVALGALGAGIGIAAAIFWCALALVAVYPGAREAARLPASAGAPDGGRPLS